MTQDTTLHCASEINLHGRRVLVTGGARGLGEAFARALVQADARVVISDVLHERGQALATELGSPACYVPIDLSDPTSISAGVALAAGKWSGMDGLINNAAITNSGGKAMNELSLDMWDRVMQVNVRGTWLTTVAAQPHHAASKTGRVVNIASDTVLWGAPKLLAYVASKGAVISMTHVDNAVRDKQWAARISDAACRRLHQAKLAISRPRQHHSAITGHAATVKATLHDASAKVTEFNLACSKFFGTVWHWQSQLLFGFEYQ